MINVYHVLTAYVFILTAYVSVREPVTSPILIRMVSNLNCVLPGEFHDVKKYNFANVIKMKSRT